MREMAPSDWEMYYQDPNVNSFARQEPLYANLFHLQDKYPQLRSTTRPKVFVLGGFHGKNGTSTEFAEFTQQLMTSEDDRQIFLDQHSQPLQDIKDIFPHNRVQGDLTALPFKDNSLDYLFLDLTIDLLSDEAVSIFALEAERTLTKTGLVVLSKRTPAYIQLQDKLRANNSGYEYKRTPRNFFSLQKLLTPLKLVMKESFDQTEMGVFARDDSPIQFTKSSPTREFFSTFPME